MNIPITNDFMFCRVMGDKSICRVVLQEILPEIDIGRMEYLEGQKTLDLAADSKSVRLDVLAGDGSRVYDIEMQCVNAGHLPKRSRYYQGHMDMALLDKGEDYKRLRDSYIIFICTFDPFGQGQYLYYFENTCRQVQSFSLGDGAKKVFVNTKGVRGEISGGLEALLDYFENRHGQATELIQEIEDAVAEANGDTLWRKKMLSLEMRMREREQIGEERATLRLVEKMIHENQKVDFIAQLTGVSEEEILEIAQNQGKDKQSLPSNAAVAEANRDMLWRKEMRSLEMRMKELENLGVEIGVKIGEERATLRLVEKMIYENQKVDFIARLTGVSEADIQKIAQQIQPK